MTLESSRPRKRVPNGKFRDTERSLLPNLVLVLGTMKSVVSAERQITADWQCDITKMYAGDLLLCAVCINSANLNWIR